MWFTIKQSSFEKEVKLKHGNFYSYEITVADGDGAESTCQLLQKPDTPEPMVNGRIHGYIEDSDYGFKFKKTQPEDGGSSMTQSKPTVHSGGSPGGSGNNDTQMQIIRQSSLKAAVDLCIANQRGEKLIDVGEVLGIADQFVVYASTGQALSALDAHIAATVEESKLPFDEQPK